jgi:hypothetical protein
MREFGLFNTPKNVAFKLFGLISPYHVVYGEKNSVPIRRLLQEKFRQILSDENWAKILPFMHSSKDEIFGEIYFRLKHLAKNKKIDDIDLMDIAFLIGDSLLIHEVMRLSNINFNQRTLWNAILCDNANTLRFLAQHGLGLTHSLLDEAAHHQCLEIVKYGISIGISPDNTTLGYAARGGDMRILRLLIEECGLQPTQITLDYTFYKYNNYEATNYITNILNNNRAIVLPATPPLASAITPGR